MLTNLQHILLLKLKGVNKKLKFFKRIFKFLAVLLLNNGKNRSKNCFRYT